MGHNDPFLPFDYKKSKTEVPLITVIRGKGESNLPSPCAADEGAAQGRTLSRRRPFRTLSETVE